MLQFKSRIKGGNQALIQAKLKIGQPGDKYERQADAVADRVMRMSDTDTMQMQPLEEEEEEALQTKIRMQPLEEQEEETAQPKLRMQPLEEEEMMQAKAKTGGGYASPEVTNRINSTKGNGRPLSSQTNQFMNKAFGANFSDVKIHTGNHATQMNQVLGARAFTHDNNIYFNDGEYKPKSTNGKRLLAHELTHTIQQKNILNKRGSGSIFRETLKENPPVEAVPTLTNSRFVGNRVLKQILSGRISQLSSRHNGRRGAVSKVQQALVDLGFELPMYMVDGKFGDETEEALRQFRARHGPSPGNQLDGDTLAVLDRVAPAAGERHEHTVDYNRLLADNRLDITVAIGATDTNTLRETSTGNYKETKRPTEDLMAEEFRTWMQVHGFSLEIFGWAGNEHWKATLPIIWRDSDGIQHNREIDIWINLIIPGAGAAHEFGQGLSQGEITIYTGHARYGSGPDFDAKASSVENFRIGIDTALQAAGRRTRVDEARHHGVAIDEEHDLLEMVQSEEFDPNRYRVLFLNACTSLAYLDEIREHVGSPKNVDVIATRRPSRFTRVESEVGLQETQRFLEGIITAESMESIISGLNDVQRQRYSRRSQFPRGGIYTSSGLGDNPQVP